MKLDFYNVNKDYIEYLQRAEYKKRGFTRVPNMNYEGRKQKFICGIIFSAPRTHLKYFVGVTHYKIQKSENYLLVVDGDKVPVKGSLRFNYMFPVPLQLVKRKAISAEPDVAYRTLLSKELKVINQHSNEILEQAHQVYDKITNKTCSQNLLLNSCDFTYLEEKCLEYCRLHTLELSVTYAQRRESLELLEEESTPWNELLVRRTHQRREVKYLPKDKGLDRDDD